MADARPLSANEWMRTLHALAHEWSARQAGGVALAQTPAYLDLIFAFGRARLGDDVAVNGLLASAREALYHTDTDEAHRLLYDAFAYRVRQALEGRPHTGPLPHELMGRYEQIHRLLR